MRHSNHHCWTRRKRSNRRGHIPAIAGPWSLIFAALLVAGILSGCTKAPSPPPPPRLAWAQLSVLTPLHPDQRLLMAISRRLAELKDQQGHLTDRALPAPDATTGIPAAKLPALDVPASAQLPHVDDQPTINRELDAMQRELTERWQRAYLRQKRVLEDEYAQRQAAKVATLETGSDNTQREIAMAYRNELVNNRARLVIAKKMLAEANAYLTRPSANENARANAKRASDEVNTIEAKIKAAEDQMQHDLQQAKTALTAAQQAAEKANQQELIAALQQVKRRLQADADARLAEERKRLNEAPMASLPDIPAFSLPEINTQPLPVQSPEVQKQVNTANQVQQRNMRDANTHLAATIVQLQQERRRLQKQIERETREAAIGAADQHGYLLQFDHQRGKIITSQVVQWLQAYWPAEGTASP